MYEIASTRMASHAPGKLKVFATDQPDVQISEVKALVLRIIHHLQVQIAGMLVWETLGPGQTAAYCQGMVQHQGAAE